MRERRGRHSLRGSVDWNVCVRLSRKRSASHSLRGSVDWNPSSFANVHSAIFVTPFVGVWIEISKNYHLRLSIPSLPSWECGLKFIQIFRNLSSYFVTPFVGVWIEIVTVPAGQWIPTGHSLRGSVDWNSSISVNPVRASMSLPSWECGLKFLKIMQK